MLSILMRKTIDLLIQTPNLISKISDGGHILVLVSYSAIISVFFLCGTSRHMPVDFASITLWLTNGTVGSRVFMRQPNWQSSTKRFAQIWL
jgi:hypothetical protein